MSLPYKTALIVGVGSGISASVARLLVKEGVTVALAARNPGKLADLVRETGALAIELDATKPDAVARAFETVDKQLGAPDIVLYNASGRTRGAFAELDPIEVARELAVSAYGGFLVAQQAARRMLLVGRGAILLTGASASVKGYAQSAPFAMGKFALRGLAQSIARELAPKGIHVAHFVIDGAVRSASRIESSESPDSFLDPDAIARTYLHVLQQERSAWTWEIELRPWVERF